MEISILPLSKKLMRNVLLLAIVLLLACKTNKGSQLSQKDEQAIRKKYSKKAINYFYEVAFFSESKQADIHLQKWKSDIKIALSGELMRGDEQRVIYAIGKINRLNLPVKIFLINDTTQANVKMRFGAQKELSSYFKDMPSAVGLAHKIDSNDVIYKGEIVILNTVQKDAARQSLIMEEIAQIMGSITDSFSYPESMFYQGQNEPLDFNSLDQEVMHLLYEKSMLPGLTRANFEAGFGNIILQYKPEEKLLSFLKTNKFEDGVYDAVLNSCFINEIFYKHQEKVPIYVSGFNQQDSVFLRNAINCINQTVKNKTLTLYLGGNQRFSNSGITLDLRKDDQLAYQTETAIDNAKGEIFKPKRIASAVMITYKSSIKLQKKQDVIFKALFKSLGPTDLAKFDQPWYTIKDSGEMVLAKKYADILNMIYSDEFIDSLTHDQLEDVIAKLP